MENETLSIVEKQYLIESDYNVKLYNLLWQSRTLAIEVAQFEQIEIWKHLIFIKIIEEKIQNLINELKYNDVDTIINNLTETITNYDVIKSLDNISKVNTVKIKFILNILQKRVNYGKTNNMFWDMLE